LTINVAMFNAVSKQSSAIRTVVARLNIPDLPILNRDSGISLSQKTIPRRMPIARSDRAPRFRLCHLV